jgi:hypothetical protein
MLTIIDLIRHWLGSPEQLFMKLFIFSLVWLFLSPYIVKKLWNSTLPQLTNVKEISYWQSFRLLFLILVFTIGPWILELNIDM